MVEGRITHRRYAVGYYDALYTTSGESLTGYIRDGVFSVYSVVICRRNNYIGVGCGSYTAYAVRCRMPDKSKTNRGLTTYFRLIRRYARGLYVWY